jgi:NAD-dependent deacetylase
MAVSLVILTGAGISADSGLATFRGAGGLWEGRRVEEVATPEAWQADPRSVWRFYQLRRAALQGVTPNPAHEALVRLEAELAGHQIPFTLVTQNVDDLHERAGSTPIHMHGELAVLRCEPCGHTLRDTEHFEPDEFLPCPGCGFERLRPDVVWFGEMPYHMQDIERALTGCTHFAAIGTSGMVYPAAGYLAAARAVGAKTFVNSLDEPGNLDPADTFLEGRATDIVPTLAGKLLADLLSDPR